MAYPPKAHSVQGQTLDMTIVGCYNLSNKEWFSKQDPYVVIDYSGQKFRTRTDTDGGRNPSFNETIKLSLIEGLREVNASVWNSNTFERDDYIGSTKILLNKVIDCGYDDSQWQLTNSGTGKSAGVLKLILHCAAGGKTKPGKQEANPYAVSAPPACCPAPAYGAPSHSHSHHYPPQQAPAPYPQAAPYSQAAPYCAPVAPQAFVPVCQAAPQPAYPPQPMAYVAPQQPAYYGAPAYPQAPPAGYPQAPYNNQWGRGL